MAAPADGGEVDGGVSWRGHAGQPRIVINPFHCGGTLHLSPEAAERFWDKLERAIHVIFSGDPGELSFVEHYNIAFGLTTQGYARLLYEGVQRALTAEAVRMREAIQRDWKDGNDDDDDNLLTALREHWRKFEAAARNVNSFCMPVNRPAVTEMGLKPLYEMGMDVFRDQVLRWEALRRSARDALLQMFLRGRQGDTVDWQLVHEVVHLYQQLGLYEEEFEVAFLEATRAFYSQMSRRLLETSACWDLLLAVKSFHESEERIARACLEGTHTLQALLAVIDQALIGDHLERILDDECTGFVAMLRASRLSDLANAYEALFRLPHGTEAMRQRFAPYVRERARAQLLADAALAEQPVPWADRAIALRNEMRQLLEQAFQSDAKFGRTVHEVLEQVLQEFPRAQEYLSLLLDRALRSTREPCTAERIHEVLGIFRLLKNKDVFEHYYRMHLSQRLLSGAAAPALGEAGHRNDDAEQLFLLKLKEECGAVYTRRLETMFSDVRNSAAMNAEFQRRQRRFGVGSSSDAPRAHLSVCVLTTEAWPIPPPLTPNPDSLIPRQVAPLADAFRRFYIERHSNRCLQFPMQLGTAELRAYFAQRQRRHEILCTTLQMCVLLLFNDANVLSVRQMATALGMPDTSEALHQALEGLAGGRYRLLRKAAAAADDETPSPLDQYAFRDDFRSERYRLNVAATTTSDAGGSGASQRESEQLRRRTAERIERDRRPEIMACVVRIMKGARTLDHNLLVGQVTDELRARFRPSVGEVKREIEGLIEREYIMRDDSHPHTYKYVA